MAAPKETPARIYANRSMQQVHEILKKRLAAAGVRAVEERIGRPFQFFSKTRERDRLRLSDFLATCAVLEEDPDVLLGQALDGEVPPEVRPPRIVRDAQQRLSIGGAGLGATRLAELEASFQEDPREIRDTIAQDIARSSAEEAPHLLGIYASALRVDGDLTHALLVLQAALEMTRTLELPRIEADLLIRLAYVTLDRQSPLHALRHAQEGTLGYSRLNDREGEGKGFLAAGMFRYYNRDYRNAIRDLEATLERSRLPARLIAAHQIQALCWLGLDETEQARVKAAEAQRCAHQAAPWIRGKLSERDLDNR